MQSQDHWNRVYTTKATDSVSWYQEHATQSLQPIQFTGAAPSASIIDVGGGASMLSDDLLLVGYRHITVLDISAAALAAAKARLGEWAASVDWIEGDITAVELPHDAFDIWHDRAVFHFLTTRENRRIYVDAVLNSVKPGGHVIVATFTEDGPTQCSGLPVMSYSPDELHAELGASFELVRHVREEHHTPFGTTQKFVYCYFRKAA